jgi:putative membrane protein
MILIGRLIGLVIVLAISYFVYQDAEKRGMNGILWAIGTFLLCIIFLPLYLIMRKPLVGGSV